MRRLKNHKYLGKIVFAIAICFILAVVFIALKQKLSLENRLDESISEKELASHYYEKAVFEKPKGLQTPNKILSQIPKKEYRIPIITYHYIENVKDQGDTIRKSLDIVPYVFEKELEALNNNHYKTLFVRDIPKVLSGELPYSTRSAVLTFDDGYEDFYTDAFPLLKKNNIKATIYVIYDFIGRKGFMNEEELKEIIDSKLVEVGSHTLDHVYLKKTSKKVDIKQIVDSKKMFEDKFQIKIETFAYPFGAFDQLSLDTVRSAGYTAAVSVIPGIKQSTDNLFYLSRLRAGNFSYSNMTKYFENYKK